MFVAREWVRGFERCGVACLYVNNIVLVAVRKCKLKDPYAVAYSISCLRGHYRNLNSS